MQYINGLWIERGSRRLTSQNPATGEDIWQGWAAGEAEVAEAVATARAAFPAWAAQELDERVKILQRFKELVEERKEELAVAIARETGKALWDARSEVAAVIGKLGFTREAYDERTGRRTRPTPTGGQSVIRHRPHGVMAVFGPYNFPAHLPNGHIMPALLAGNTVVFKPSELTPMVGEWVLRRWEEAGLPPGVLNLVQGERETGVSLAAAAVDGILFTGSTVTGKAIHQQLAGRPEVLLALEMGGNNPLIIHETSNIPAAVHETLLSAFIGSGQRCTCARRLIVTAWEKADQFINSLIIEAQKLRVDRYDATPEPFMGPLISMREATRLVEAQATLESLGGKVLLRMKLLRDGLPFVSPAIIDMTGVKNVPDTEYFGPLIQLYRVPDIQSAVLEANKTAFGLSAAVISDSHAVFQEVRMGIRAGLVNWNRQTTGASGTSPFGGVGISGNHRPAGYYSADYCAYPMASVEAEVLTLPERLPPGMA